MCTALRLTLANNLAALPGLMETVNRFLERQAVPPEAVFRVNLAIEEIATNIIKYGYDDDAPHAVAVDITLDPDAVRLRFEDDGRPFDPLTAPPPDLQAPIAQRRIGGLGLHLVRSMCASVAYRRDGAANIIDVAVARR